MSSSLLRSEFMNIYEIHPNDPMIIVISNPSVLKIENNWKEARLSLMAGQD